MGLNVANAEAVKQQLVNDGVPARKISVVYNGLDPTRVRPPAGFSRVEALKEFGLPTEGGRRFVTLVANLRHAVKDHPTFLRAARRVRAEVPEAAFVLAGEGELEPALRSLASELGIADVVFFTGRCTRVGLPSLLPSRLR